MKTTAQSLNKKLFFFSIPLIGSLLTQQLYSAADMMIIGQLLGVRELAAVGNACSIILLFIVISGGIELAIEIIFSRYLGKKDEERLAKGVSNLLVAGFILGILLAAAGFLSLPFFFDLLNIPADLLVLTRTYSLIYLFGVPFIYLYDISRAMLISLGESKKSFYLILSSSLLNIVLNLLFILDFRMGIAGAALGTVLSQALLMGISLLQLYKKMKLNRYFELKITIDTRQLKEVMTIALPSIFQQFVITLSSMFLQSFVNQFGNDIIIGFLAVTKVMTVTRIAVSGFSQTLSIFSAQLFAGENYSELRQSYHFLTKLSLLYSGFISIVYLTFPRQLCQLFFDSAQHPEGYTFFKTYLLISIGTLIMTVFKFMNESLLRSSLHMKDYLLCNIGDLIIKVAATYLLMHVISADAFWLGEVLGRSFATLLSFLFVCQIKKKA